MKNSLRTFEQDSWQLLKNNVTSKVIRYFFDLAWVPSFFFFFLFLLLLFFTSRDPDLNLT